MCLCFYKQLLFPSPVGCSPRPSSVWAAQRAPVYDSNRYCTSFCSCQNQRSLWWDGGPGGSSVWPDHDAQSSEKPSTSSQKRSAPTCATSQQCCKETEIKESWLKMWTKTWLWISIKFNWHHFWMCASTKEFESYQGEGHFQRII